MPRDPLIPGLREYDAPRRKRKPAVWIYTLGIIVVAFGLIVVGGLVAGIGPLRSLGTSESPLQPMSWRPTADPRVIQVAVMLPESGLCTGDEVLVRAIERPNVLEVSAVRAAPRGAADCAGIGISGDQAWVDLSLDDPMGERTAVRTGDRMPLEKQPAVG